LPTTGSPNSPSETGCHTHAAQFGGCNQVTAGIGSTARTSPQLLADIQQLVPNSNL
jgi:hypothetical protein